MADNVAITAGTGTSVGTDDISGVHYQKMKVYDGTADSTNALVVDSSGRITTKASVSVLRIQVTPTVSTTPAYTAKDAVGGLMTFSNAASSSGGSCLIEAVQVVDKAQQMKDYDLILFDRTVTAPTDNAAFDPSDTELGYVVAIVPIGGWADLNDNSVHSSPVGITALLNGTDLFGVLVSRSPTGPTFAATSDVVVTLTVARD